MATMRRICEVIEKTSRDTIESKKLALRMDNEKGEDEAQDMISILGKYLDSQGVVGGNTHQLLKFGKTSKLPQMSVYQTLSFLVKWLLLHLLRRIRPPERFHEQCNYLPSILKYKIPCEKR